MMKLLFPPFPESFEKLTVGQRGQWAVLFILQTAACALGAVLVFLPPLP